jgi:selenobiotic family peptide radical SAM maturase
MLRDQILCGRKTMRFTLQWHITNACEAHCTHCYDRNDYNALPLDTCLTILQDFQSFCNTHKVHGQISLTGGNPLLHPNFWELYKAIADANIPVSILGNAVDETILSRLFAIKRPVYYQVSLEGLPETNDSIRGSGHYQRTIEFLQLARTHGLTTHVMLTLHKENIGQVIPLGISLESLVRKFTFNRLAQVGEGAALAIPTHEEYKIFLHEYLAAAKQHPVLGFKDNLFNIIRHQNKKSYFDGCTGYGCGAAFNFVAVLPNGEVHACRKFPSPLGQLPVKTLAEIYNSPLAHKYRKGPTACRHCKIRHHCRGCLAVIHSHGGNPFIDCDPQCFFMK